MSNESYIMMNTTFDPAKVRKFAASKGYSLKKVRNQDLYDLNDTVENDCVVKHAPLSEIHSYLCSNDD